jgi:hypothetical protein
MSADAPPSPPPGFTGVRHRILAAAQDGPHHVTLAVYRFPPGDGDPPGAIDVPYVELHETHNGARPGRVMALSAIVHMAQNASDDEVWAIGGRETPGRPDATIPRRDADAILTRLTAARGWPAHASNGWTIDAIGGPFRPDAPTWIRVMCEPVHLAPGETVETQVERFAAWLAGLGWALTQESMMHPACFRLVPGVVAVGAVEVSHAPR